MNGKKQKDNVVRKVIHCEGFVQDQETLDKIDNVLSAWSSCVRLTYKRLSEGIEDILEIRRQCKKFYYPTLVASLIKDAIEAGCQVFTRWNVRKKHLQESSTKLEDKLTKVKNPKVIEKIQEKLIRNKLQLKQGLVFGGRLLWNSVCEKKTSKDVWKLKRDGQAYSRGESGRFGNRHFRVESVNSKYVLRVSVGPHKFVSMNLFVPTKFNDEFKELVDLALQNKIIYDVRIIRKLTASRKFYVIITYEAPKPALVVDFSNGAIGVDTNPLQIGLCETGLDGNPIKFSTTFNSKMFFVKSAKRDYEISCVINQIIEYSKQVNKGIVAENLEFKKDEVPQLNGQRWNRIKSNFVWRKFLTKLERKCLLEGIAFKKVNPAFTSVIGYFKYSSIYGVRTHEAAAYVIARRGLGFQEKLSLALYPKKRVRSLILSLLEESSLGKKFHSWRLWRKLRDNYQTVLTDLRKSLPAPREVGEIVLSNGIPLAREFLVNPILEPVG